ncbi:MAG: TIGR04255 family protein [Candidatus Bipolaricaulia bacterium]
MGRKYRNPPIIEVICEFRFDPSSPWDLAIPGLVYQELQNEFPKRRQAKQFEVGLRSRAEGVEQEVRTADRMQFLREDEKALIQVDQNLLAVNHLKPYPTWKGFLPLIRRGFEMYCEVAKPTGIQRIGLRYINRIEFPGPGVELEDYFSFYPFLGPKLPRDHGAFIVGVDIPYEDSRDSLRLQSVNVNSEQPETIAILLDLDYSLQQPNGVELETVFQWVDNAHARVEEVFEGCITDKLRELFEEVKS